MSFGKNQLSFTDPKVRDQEVVYLGPNEFIHDRPFVHSSAEAWKISTRHDWTIEQASEVIGPFA